MFNYIKAELYRNFNRMYFWMFTGIIAALPLLLIIVSKVNSISGVNLSMLLDTTLLMLSMPVFMLAGIIDMVTSEENKHQTMRNVITFGVPRHKFILSKLIVSVILAFIAAFIIMTVFYGSTAILFGIDEGVAAILPKVAIRLLTAIPLWIGAISIGTFLGIAITNNTLFGFAYAGVFFLTSKIIFVLSYFVSEKFAKLNKYLITTRLAGLKAPNLTSNELWTSALIGLAYTVAFAVISMLYFNRKEVK
ncbi:ABC transporter permease [Clostridium swellfunianum]|uniref:ABC transporter permease n=1 Tax=Clostridium swellfunianum TaxID=1367462 RepID=UPI00202F3B5D|nr:ABC transporter permease [Clostridium swellfunianum]MCM0647223.1 ABC transporter permease [Clostridium swellfunianum]